MSTTDLFLSMIAFAVFGLGFMICSMFFYFKIKNSMLEMQVFQVKLMRQFIQVICESKEEDTP